MSLKLEKHLKSNLFALKGTWVNKNCGYEDSICEILGFKAEKGRYWDAFWESHYLEFKKGKSVWLDLVRYGEILKESNEDACKEVLNLFFIPNEERVGIIEIICVKSKSIIEKLRLNDKYSTMLLELNEQVPRSLNAQASLTVADIRNIAEFIVK